MPQKKQTVKKNKSSPKGTPKTPPHIKIGGGSRTKTIVKDKLHGANHEIIETDPPHMTKEQIEDAAENPLNRPSEGKLIRTLMEEWKKRALEAEKTLVKKLNEIETLTNGQMLSADKAAPMEVQKMKEQIIELQERLSPFKYEFTIGGTLVSVMVRPRSKEVIPLTQ